MSFETLSLASLLAASLGWASSAPMPAATPTPGAAAPAPLAAPDAPGVPVTPVGVRLLAAAKLGNLALVKALVEQEHALVDPPEGERTALITAALHGHVPVLDYLLARGARIDARDAQGRSALWAAVWGRQAAASARLLAGGASPDVRSAAGEPLLFMAVERGPVESVRALLDKGARVDAPSQSALFPGVTPLQRAAHLGQAPLVALLLERGADLRHQDRLGRGVLRLAVTSGVADVVRLLLDRGAALEERDAQGRGPLAWAALDGQFEILELLLARGADARARDREGKLASDLATGRNAAEIRARLAVAPTPAPPKATPAQ